MNVLVTAKLKWKTGRNIVPKTTGAGRGIRFVAMVVLVSGMVSPGKSNAASEETDWKNSITVKTGTFALKRGGQNLEVYGDWVCGPFCLWEGYAINPFPVEFDTASREVVGLAYERATAHGFSFGADYLHVRNSYTATPVGSSSGSMRTHYLFGVIKTSFFPQSGFQPFVGAGAGRVQADMSGSISRSASGWAAEAMIGARYQFGRIGGGIEYRFIYAPDASIEEDGSSGTGSIHGDLDLSGAGLFVTIGTHF